MKELVRKTIEKRASIVLAYPDLTALWPTPNIDVCWENADAADPLQVRARADVRAAITGSWEAASRVRFHGWSNCEPDSEGIRILVEDTREGSYTRFLGRKLDGRPGGMVLNLTLKNWRPKCGTGADCLAQVAIHEFGHALGFAHEQNRPDEPDAECRKLHQGQSGTCTFCAADRKSIMSYCRTDWSNGGGLSACDRSSVAFLYGD